MIRDKLGRSLVSRLSAKAPASTARAHPQDPFGQRPKQAYGVAPVQTTRPTTHAYFATMQRTLPGVPLMLDVGGVPAAQVLQATPVRPSFESSRPTFSRVHGIAPSPVAAMNVGRSGVDLRINAYRDAVAQPLYPLAEPPTPATDPLGGDPLEQSMSRLESLDWNPKSLAKRADRAVGDLAKDLGVEKKWLYLGGAAVAALLVLR
jgi:hypothetical protein